MVDPGTYAFLTQPVTATKRDFVTAVARVLQEAPEEVLMDSSGIGSSGQWEDSAGRISEVDALIVALRAYYALSGTPTPETLDLHAEVRSYLS